MIEAKTINRRPKCGGAGGFEGILVVRFHMAGTWGHPWETSGEDKLVYRSHSVKCCECGSRVPIDIAEGYEPPHI